MHLWFKKIKRKNVVFEASVSLGKGLLALSKESITPFEPSVKLDLIQSLGLPWVENHLNESSNKNAIILNSLFNQNVC